MLSGILNSERAIIVNIQIMRIFTKLREMLVENLSIRLEIENIKKKLTNQDNVFSEMKAFIENMPLLAASTGHEGQQACKQILEVSETAHHLKDSLEKYSF